MYCSCLGCIGSIDWFDHTTLASNLTSPKLDSSACYFRACTHCARAWLFTSENSAHVSMVKVLLHWCVASLEKCCCTYEPRGALLAWRQTIRPNKHSCLFSILSFVGFTLAWRNANKPSMKNMFLACVTQHSQKQWPSRHIWRRQASSKNWY